MKSLLKGHYLDKRNTIKPMWDALNWSKKSLPVSYYHSFVSVAR
jgi:hypothetical protein